MPLGDGQAWFKACAPVQHFEPRLTRTLAERWPGLLPGVLAVDEQRSWLLMADAGTPMRELGNPPERWLDLLPRYAELQSAEAASADEHLAHGVPDLRVHTLPDRYDDWRRHDLPLDAGAREELRRFGARFAALCEDLDRSGVPGSLQHDDLHHGNVYLNPEGSRILDWGDSSVAHPFTSLVVTFRFLEEVNRLEPGHVWFDRLRDAYLEPWGPGPAGIFQVAMQVGTVAHAIAWLRQREAMPATARPRFDPAYRNILRRAHDVLQTA